MLYYLQGLTVTQIKKIRVLLDDEIANCRKQVEEWEKMRNSTLFEIGNLLHDDVPVSNDEVCWSQISASLFKRCYYLVQFLMQLAAGKSYIHIDL